MLYVKSREPEISPEVFRSPGSEYRGTPFWSWNCKVTKELIREQMAVFQKMGFGGAHLHPRTGLETEYLGEEFLELVKYADEQAKERGMLCWLYDEDRYPSGAAGGIVTEDWSFRARHLLLTRERKENMCSSYEEFQKCIAAGGKPAGYYLTSYRIKIRDGRLVSYRQILGGEPSRDSRDQECREGKLWLAYVELMRESPWFNDQTYVDVMNKKAVERFLEVTHERYYKVLGDEFGKSIPAIFTDEPQIKGSLALPDGDAEYDMTLSYTDDLPETFEQCFGVNLLQVVPELVWELPEGRWSVHRYHYHDHLTERFVSAYSDTIAKWCEEHHIAMTGHYMSEPTLYSQTLRLGEAMRCYRRQQIPGIDILCGDPEYSTAKQAVSVARQYGREAVLSELYGVNHWDFDFKGHKLQGDWQAALGVTVRCHHLAFMSMEGEAKRDWPASISYQSPWYEQYSYIEDYFARVNTVLTRGRAEVKVGVIHPIESYWMCYGPVAQTQGLRDQMDEDYRHLMEWLLFGTVDFDLISEALLPELSGGCPQGDKPLFAVGEMAYQTVLVPGLLTIRGTTLDRLESFVQAGGNVIFAGDVPVLVDGEPSDRAKLLARGCRRIPFQPRALLEALENDRTVEIRYENGRLSDNLFYQMRREEACRWLFVCHVNRKRNRVDQAEHMTVRIRGAYQVKCYQALTGEICEPETDVRYENGWTVCKVSLYAEDSFLWKLTEAEAASAQDAGERVSEPECLEAAACMAEGGQDREIPLGKTMPFYGLVAGPSAGSRTPARILETIYEPDDVSLAEPNVLLLDAASWKLDGGEEQPVTEILRLDNEIRTLLGYPHRQDAYMQPWRIRNAPREHTVTLRYTIESRCDTGELLLAMERPGEADIWMNGERCAGECGYFTDVFIRTVRIPGLHRGENELLLEIPYGRKTNLENLYLLGGFGAEVWGTKAFVTHMADKLYFGDITRQRLPFYGGTVFYKMHFTLEQEGKISVRVPHFTAPVLEVVLDGQSKGVIAFAPHVLKLGLTAAGVHKLEIRACGNRFNSFGTLHNCNDEYQWYGPDSYRTKGSEWSEAWCLRPFGILSRVEILED